MTVTSPIFVQSGELVISESPAELVTILGSCVSVCLWDRRLKTGGMNHYLLPKSKDERGHDGGIAATQMLVQSMMDGGSRIDDLEAKVFGGGNKFFDQNFLVVGPQNVDAAMHVLFDAGIPIVEKNIGGKNGRKIRFNTETGEVKVIMVNWWSIAIQPNTLVNHRYPLHPIRYPESSFRYDLQIH